MTSSHLFITGGAKRIGRNIALDYARQGCQNISLHYCHSKQEAFATQKEIMHYGTKCVLTHGDFLKMSSFEALFKDLPSPVTTLIFNASLFQKDNLDSITQDILNRHLHINSIAPILITKAFRQQLGAAQGHIIFLLDGMDGWSISPKFLSYSLSRKMIESFIEIYTTTLAPNIRMNGIALGATLVGDMEKEHTITKIKMASPLKNTSNIQQVIDTIHYLEQTDTITGQIIKLNSGLHLPKNR